MFPDISNFFGIVIIMAEMNYENNTQVVIHQNYTGVCQVWLVSAAVSLCVNVSYLK